MGRFSLGNLQTRQAEQLIILNFIMEKMRAHRAHRHTHTHTMAHWHMHIVACSCMCTHIYTPWHTDTCTLWHVLACTCVCTHTHTHMKRGNSKCTVLVTFYLTNQTSWSGDLCGNVTDQFLKHTTQNKTCTFLLSQRSQAQCSDHIIYFSCVSF